MAQRVPTVLLIGLVLIAGCNTASVPGVGPQVSCEKGSIPQGASVDALIPDPPENWEVEPFSEEEDVSVSVYMDEGEKTVAKRYRDPNGRTHYLLVTRWETSEKAKKETKNTSLLSAATAVDGSLTVRDMTNASRNVSKTLVTSVPCISDADIIEPTTINIDVPGMGGNLTISNFGYSVEPTSLGGMQLNVRIGGNANNTGIKLLLSGPNKNTLDTAFISEEDMYDGAEGVSLGLGENPGGGEYTLLIMKSDSSYGEGEIVQKKTITFEGSNLEISNVNIDISEKSFQDGWTINGVVVEVANSGGIRGEVTEIELVVNGETNSIGPIVAHGVSPEETSTFEHSGFGLPNPKDGKNTFTIRVYSHGEVVAEVTKTTNVG